MLRSRLWITAVALTLVACDRMPTNPSTAGSAGVQPASDVNMLRGVAIIATDSDGIANVMLTTSDGTAYRLIGPNAQAAVAASNGQEIVVYGRLTSMDLYVETFMLIQETHECVAGPPFTDDPGCIVQIQARRAGRKP